MSQPSDVLVVGSINLDLTRHVEHHPRPGETVLAGVGYRGLGGKGANQAVAAAAAGAAVTFVGCVGSDEEGAQALVLLRAAGVDTSPVRTLPGQATGTALIVVNRTGENTIVVGLAANAKLTASQVDEALAAASAHRPLVLAQGETPPSVLAHLARRSTELGARFVLNLAPAVDVPDLHWSDVDLLVVNELEARTVAELAGVDVATDARTTARLLTEGLDTSVVLTLGSHGAVYAEATGASGFVPAQPVERVVDTTGAGDAFVGALVSALVRNEPLGIAVEHGTRAGAAAVAHGRSAAQTIAGGGPPPARADAVPDNTITTAERSS